MVSPHISSRLAKRQQQVFLRQTVITVIVAIALTAAFIFVIVPNFIRIFFNLTSGTQDAITASPSLPPQVPVFSSPPDATQSAQVSVTGYAQANTTVVLMLNGNQEDRQVVGDDGTFHFDIQLNDGENKVAAFAVDDAKQESAVSQTYTIIHDTAPPSLEISQPQDNQSFDTRKNQVMSVIGKTDPQTTLRLNDRLIYVQDDGSFNTSFTLQEGDNNLNFVAQDKAGNQTQKALKVTFKL